MNFSQWSQPKALDCFDLEGEMNIAKKMSVRFKCVAAIAGILLSTSVLAWGGTTTGKIVQIHVGNAGNLPFRVYLEGAPILCQGGIAEGYIDDADGNYKVFVATLLMAKATGSRVTLYADLGAFNRCRIGYVVME
jgi:hypothetical protein